MLQDEKVHRSRWMAHVMNVLCMPSFMVGIILLCHDYIQGVSLCRSQNQDIKHHCKLTQHDVLAIQTDAVNHNPNMFPSH